MQQQTNKQKELHNVEFMQVLRLQLQSVHFISAYSSLSLSLFFILFFFILVKFIKDWKFDIERLVAILVSRLSRCHLDSQQRQVSTNPKDKKEK